MIVVLGLFWLYDWANGPRDDSNNRYSDNGRGAGSAYEQPANDQSRGMSVRPTVGTFMIDDVETAGIEVPAGMFASTQLLGSTRVAFELYVNDRLATEWSATGERKDYVGDVAGQHTHKYKLKPGQAVRTMEVAFVIYTGSRPDPAVWIPAAQAAGRIDIER